VKIGDEDSALEGTPYLIASDFAGKEEREKYAIELVRQLEIVTIRNPQLAQYVKLVLFKFFVLQLVHL
jgi:hypothetical protein